MSKWVIAKYADSFLEEDGPEASVWDHVGNSFTGRQVGCPTEPFNTKEEGEEWLAKMTDFNPAVGYGLIEVEDQSSWIKKV